MTCLPPQLPNWEDLVKDSIRASKFLNFQEAGEPKLEGNQALNFPVKWT